MSGDDSKPKTAEEVLLSTGVIALTAQQVDTAAAAVAPQTGIEKFAQDWNALSSAATNAISTGWDNHVAPEIKKFGGDFEAISDDGRRKWSDLSSAVTGAVTHPTTEGVTLATKVWEAEKYYHLQGHGGQALRDGAAFAVETFAGAVGVVAEGLQKDAEKIEKAVDTVTRRVTNAFKP